MPPARLKDKEVFFKHRHARVYPTLHYTRWKPRAEQEWVGLTVIERRNEAARLRTAAAAQVPTVDWANIPLVAPAIPIGAGLAPAGAVPVPVAAPGPALGPAPPPPAASAALAPPGPASLPPAPPATPTALITWDDDSSANDDDSGDDNNVFAKPGVATAAVVPENVMAELLVGHQLNEDNVATTRRVTIEMNIPTGTPTWVHMKEIGAGGFGIANLYAQRNAQNEITDRILVKDSFHQAAEWGSILFWHGDPRDKLARKPMEIKAMEMLLGKPGGSESVNPKNIVQLRSQSVNHYQMSTRMIMNFCGLGSLRNLLEEYAAWGTSIPEPFIWHAFEALANACILMKYGNMGEQQTDRRVDWEQIVHKGESTE